MSNELSRNKTLYKIFLVFSKYLPIILFIIQSISLIFNYFRISIPILSCIGGSSLIFMGLLLIISYVFNFCYLYRIPIYGNALLGIICILRYSGLLPIDLIDLYRIFAFIFCSTTITYIVLMYKNRNKPKVDYIRSFCENYCC